jgi:hypothetical protein
LYSNRFIETTSPDHPLETSKLVPSFHCLRRSEASCYFRVKTMFIAALIFVISIAVIVQFGLLSWHAALIRVAAQPLTLPNEDRAAAKSLIRGDFANIIAYGKLCPDFADGSYLKLRAVRFYYQGLELLKGLSHMAWTTSEMNLCTRYAAVMLSNHLERNQAVLASVRSI